MKVSAIKNTKSQTNSFAFNTHKTRPQTATNFNFDEPLIDDTINLPFDVDRHEGANLIDLIDKEVEALKADSEEYSKVVEKQKEMMRKMNSEKKNQMSLISTYAEKSSNLSNQGLNGYISLDDFEKQKEEHSQSMSQLELELSIRKRKEQENVNKLLKMYEDDEEMLEKLHQIEKDIEKEFNEKRQGEKYFPEEKEISKYSRSKTQRNVQIKTQEGKNTKTIKRAGVTKQKESLPLDEEDEKFVQEYANYLVKKQFPEESIIQDREKLWNKTGIKSQSLIAKRVLEYKNRRRNKNSQDYSDHYYSVGDSNSPRSLSIESVSSNPGAKNQKNNQKTMNNKYQSDKSSMTSHLAFIKLIFTLLDKEKRGVLNKEDILNKLIMEDKILRDLGFETEDEFLLGLRSFPTQLQEYMNEQELIGFLISRSELAEEYLEQFRNNTEELRVKEENNFEFNNYGVGMSTEEMEMDIALEMEMENLDYEQNMINPHTKPPQRNHSNKLHNKTLTTELKDKISKNNSKVDIKYKDYTDFISKYKTKGNLNFTIPKVFEFTKKEKEYSMKKLAKMQEIIDQRRRKEDELMSYKFRANYLNRDIFMGNLQNVIETEKAKRKYRTEKLKEQIIQNMRPFSFYEQDERKYKEKLQKVCEPPQFVPFKATAIPWTSQVNLYDEIIEKMEKERRARVKQRAVDIKNAAKLPPRMELHEKEKKQKEEEMKMMEVTQSKQRSQSSFKAKEIPDFARAQETFINTLERKKKMAKPTEPIPFAFHEPKKKASLRGYLDQENDPQIKNPQSRHNISVVIQKIQQKPKIEPAATKSLNLLMAARRKELEERQRKEEERLLQDKLRKEKQERLKDRVINSKAIVDNSKALEDKRIRQQEDFKRNLDEKKQTYQQDLARRLQRVYNKPLMLEASLGKPEKFNVNRNMKEKISEVMFHQDREEDLEGDQNQNDDGEIEEEEEQIYEGEEEEPEEIEA